MPPRDFSEDGAFGATDNSAPSASGSGGFGSSMSGFSTLGAAPTFDLASWSNTLNRGGDPMPNQPPNSIYPPNGYQRVASFEAGGAIDEDPNATDPQGSQMGNQLQQAINKALGTVDNVLSYVRKQHGLGGGDGAEGGDGAIQDTQMAGAMPTMPGNQSESGIPRPRPQPRPQQVAGRMPATPGNQSESGVARPQPMPGPLPPTSNPFGKRADASDQDSDDDQSGAIPDTEEQETA